MLRLCSTPLFWMVFLRADGMLFPIAFPFVPPAAPLRLTKADLLEKGLIGPDSAARRQALCRKLSLPERMTPNALLQALNTLLTEEEWAAL